LNILLNRVSGDWDWDILANEFEVADLLDWGFTDFDLEMHDLSGEPEATPEPSAEPDQKGLVTCPECGHEFMAAGGVTEG
jgi:hypothetical protein